MELLGDTFGVGIRLGGEPRLRPVTTLDHSLKACVSALTPNCTAVKDKTQPKQFWIGTPPKWSSSPTSAGGLSLQPDSARAPDAIGSVQLGSMLVPPCTCP